MSIDTITVKVPGKGNVTYPIDPKYHGHTDARMPDRPRRGRLPASIQCQGYRVVLTHSGYV